MDMDMADMDMMLHTMTHPMVPLRTFLDANFSCRDVSDVTKRSRLAALFQVSIFCRISGFDEFDEAPPPGIQAVAFVVFTLLHCYMIYFPKRKSNTLCLSHFNFLAIHCRLQQ